MGAASKNLEVKMKLVTRFELAAKSENELHGLLRDAFNELARSEFGSHERRNALASIENIQIEIGLRLWFGLTWIMQYLTNILDLEKLFPFFQ